MRSALAIVFAAALAAVIVPPAWTDEPPGDDRAGMCDAYDGVSFTFCVAFCEARLCDQLAADDARCALLRHGFESVTAGAALPCETGAATAAPAPAGPPVTGS